MRKFILIVLVLLAQSLVAQKIGVKRSVKNTYKIDENAIIFDRDSGRKMDFNEFIEASERYPNFDIVVRDEDKNGNALSFFFIKNKMEQANGKKDSSSIDIVRNDIFGNLFKLNDINTKRCLIILQLDLQFPRVNLEHLMEAEQAAIKRGYTSVILTTTNLKQSKEFALKHNLKSVIIPNSSNLINQFQSRRFPAYFILNTNKVIVSTLKYSYEVEDNLKALD